MAELYPLPHLPETRRPFGSDEFLWRIARALQLKKGKKVLELGAVVDGPAAIFAKEFGCRVVAASLGQGSQESLEKSFKDLGLSQQVECRWVELSALPFAEAEFDAIAVLGQLMPLGAAVESLRRFLAPNGRLALVYPVRIGRAPDATAIGYWSERLGEPLPGIPEALAVVARSGYEAESAEAMSLSELADHYGALESYLPSDEAAVAPFRGEIDAHRAQGEKLSTSYGLIVGRRREPEEKPPVIRE